MNLNLLPDSDGFYAEADTIEKLMQICYNQTNQDKTKHFKTPDMDKIVAYQTYYPIGDRLK